MAAIHIGGRDLDVRAQTLGMVKHKLRPWRAADVKDDGHEDHAAAFFHIYVGHNDGVTLDWLLDNLPADAAALTKLMREVVIAAGSTPREQTPAGEAVSP